MFKEPLTDNSAEWIFFDSQLGKGVRMRMTVAANIDYSLVSERCYFSCNFEQA